jgi:hypothetical protein
MRNVIAGFRWSRVFHGILRIRERRKAEIMDEKMKFRSAEDDVLFKEGAVLSVGAGL